VRQFEIELGIGDSIRIGDDVYTVVDIENGEVGFRIDSADDFFEPFEALALAK